MLSMGSQSERKWEEMESGYSTRFIALPGQGEGID